MCPTPPPRSPSRMSSASRPEAIKKGLSSFGGVKRRFTQTGAWNGVEIFDDYGHHPVEIKAVLKAARDATSGPRHRRSPSRTASRGCAICSTISPPASTMPTRSLVAPVYAAGEDPIDGVTSETLVARIRSGGHRDARYIDEPRAIAPMVRELAKPGDFVVFLGAGNITQWAYALPKELAARGRGCRMIRGEALLDQPRRPACRLCAAASRRMRRWTRSPGSAPAAWPTRCSSRPTRTISRPS